MMEAAVGAISFAKLNVPHPCENARARPFSAAIVVSHPLSEKKETKKRKVRRTWEEGAVGGKREEVGANS